MASDLIQGILDLKVKADKAFERRIQEPYRPRRNSASMVGDPCTRYIVYNRIHGTRKKVEPGLQRIFSRGQLLESHVMTELSECGIEVDNVQFQFTFDDLNLSGRGDFTIKVDGTSIPVEQKVVLFSDRIQSVEDFIWGDNRHYQRYPVQLNIAMMALGASFGTFLVFDPVTFNWRFLPQEFSWPMWEKTIETCRSIERHLIDGTLPDRIPFREDWCGSCDYADICLDQFPFHQVDSLNDPGLVELLDRRAQLKDLAAEYAQVDKSLKIRLPEQEGIVMAGGWAIEGKLVHRKGYTVAEGSYLRREFRKLKS